MRSLLRIFAWFAWLWQRIAAKRDADAPAKAKAEADAAVLKSREDGGKALEEMLRKDLNRTP